MILFAARAGPVDLERRNVDALGRLNDEVNQIILRNSLLHIGWEQKTLCAICVLEPCHAMILPDSQARGERGKSDRLLA